MINTLKGFLYKITEIDEHIAITMFTLMSKYYDNLKLENFLNDLTDKDCVILLKNLKDEIKGFTTLKIYDFEVDKFNIKVVYSGDTIVEKSYTWELELHRCWGKFVFDLVSMQPDYRFYWLLISKGHKTYKFLPIYFKTFYPCYHKETPQKKKKIMDMFGNLKFHKDYDPHAGLIYNGGNKDFLKKGQLLIPKEPKSNPHINFFLNKNPEFFKGNELMCITRLSWDNLQKTYYRLMR